MLAEGSALRAAHGKLAAHKPIAEQGLYEIFAMAGIGDMAGGREGIAVPLTANNGECNIAHVLPSPRGHGGAGDTLLTGGHCQIVQC